MPTPKGGPPTIGPFFPENYMKMKTFWIRGGGRPLRSLDPPLIRMQRTSTTNFTTTRTFLLLLVNVCLPFKNGNTIEKWKLIYLRITLIIVTNLEEFFGSQVILHVVMSLSVTHWSRSLVNPNFLDLKSGTGIPVKVRRSINTINIGDRIHLPRKRNGWNDLL